MNVTQLYSASILVEDQGVKILCDPWLTGREHAGSWGIYPPYDFKPEEFDDVDFIWISHIHNDHLSMETLSKLNKDIPVLIHNFPKKGMKSTLEYLGFSVIELQHNVRTRLRKNLYMNILAADNCDPEICGRLMGCSVFEKQFGTMQIDTMAVIDNNDQVMVNVNDCPFPIAQTTALQIKKQYENIDLLLLGYVRASSHPQCFEFNKEKMIREFQNKQNNTLEIAIKFLELFKPKYYMPFAGSYTLCGKSAELNKYRGEPELHIAVDWFKKRIPESFSKMVALNSNATFDITTGTQTKPFVPIDEDEKQEYIDNVLSKLKYTYEYEPHPTRESMIKLLPKCYENFEKAREKYHWSSDTKILFNLEDDFVSVSCDGNGYNIISAEKAETIQQLFMMKLDQRLLYWILQGPRKSHWNQADGGSHIRYRREPDNYERGLYYCLNEFFSSTYD